MKRMTGIFVTLGMLLSWASNASLVVKVDPPKAAGTKALIKLTLRNTFSQNVESARATVFLLNDEGKVVGQSTQWVIGGSKDRPALAANASTTFNFVLNQKKPFTKARLVFTKLVLDGGKSVNPRDNVEMLDPEQQPPTK